MKRTYNSADERILAGFRRFSNILKREEFGHHGKARILSLLAKNGPMTQRNIQEEVEITSSSASEILTKMEDHRLITRRPDPDDSRGRIVTITEEGLKKNAEFAAEKKAKAQKLFNALSEDEKAVMASLFDKIQDSWYEEGLFYGDCRNHRKHLEKIS